MYNLRETSERKVDKEEKRGQIQSILGMIKNLTHVKH